MTTETVFDVDVDNVSGLAALLKCEPRRVDALLREYDIPAQGLVAGKPVYPVDLVWKAYGEDCVEADAIHKADIQLDIFRMLRMLNKALIRGQEIGLKYEMSTTVRGARTLLEVTEVVVESEK